MNEFLMNAIMSGGLLSIALALIGTIVVLKRMSFLGAGLSHAAFAGVIISLILEIPVLVGAFLYNLIASIGILKLRKAANADALIGIIFSFSMALGIMLVYVEGINASIVQILFGDILSISRSDIVISFISTLIILALFYIKGKKLIYFAFDEEYLKTKGENTEMLYTLLLIALALIITVSIKLIGILLVSSFLVIPPSSAIMISRNTKQMIFYSVLFSLISLAAGLFLSFSFDIPSGAMVVITSTLIFVILYLKNKIEGKNESKM